MEHRQIAFLTLQGIDLLVWTSWNVFSGLVLHCAHGHRPDRNDLQRPAWNFWHRDCGLPFATRPTNRCRWALGNSDALLFVMTGKTRGLLVLLGNLDMLNAARTDWNMPCRRQLANTSARHGRIDNTKAQSLLASPGPPERKVGRY